MFSKINFLLNFDSGIQETVGTLQSMPGQDLALNIDNDIAQTLSNHNVSETPIIGICYNFVK